MVPRLVLLFIFLAGWLPTESHAQRKEPSGVAPRQPVPLSLKIRREGKTEIPLRIVGKAGEPLTYLIRTPPVTGKLSEPRVIDRETSSVIYEPSNDLAVTTDKFFYAVRSSAGVSASVEVTIAIVDQPPELSYPNLLEFSTVRAGGTISRMLEITNKGGGLASGEILVSAPWKVEGPTGYKLRTADVAVFKVLFTPTTGGSFNGIFRFSSDPEHHGTLTGTGEAAVVVEPTQVTLQQVAGDVVRTGKFEVTNQTDEPFTLTIQPDPRLELPDQITLPPRGKETVSMQTKPGDAQALETNVRLSQGELAITVAIKAPRIDAILRANPESLDFGKLPLGKSGSASFQLENFGGTPGEAVWETSEPFHVAQKTVLLLPGQKKSLTVEVAARKPGKYRGALKFKAGAQSFELPLEAEYVAGGPPTGKSASPVYAPSPTATEPAEETIEPKVVLPSSVPAGWLPSPKLPEGVQVTNVTTSDAVLEWPAVLSTASRFKLEMRQFFRGKDGSLQVTWVAPTDVPITRKGDYYVATMTGLEPGQPYTVQIVPVPDSGPPAARLFAIDFITRPAIPFSERLPRKSMMLFVLAGLVGWQVYRRFFRRK